jgi:hypothetical protein
VLSLVRPAGRSTITLSHEHGTTDMTNRTDPAVSPAMVTATR